MYTAGMHFSLTFSSLMALFDRKLDAGYKIGYLHGYWEAEVAFYVLFAFHLQVKLLWKTSSSLVALVVVAMLVRLQCC